MRVVILRTDRLGELVLTLAVAEALRQADARASIAMAVQARYAELVALHPAVQQVMPLAGGPFGWRQGRWLARALRQGRFDVAIVANPHQWLHWAVWRAGIPRRIGYARKWDWCLTDRVPDTKRESLRHDLEWDLELLKPLGITPQRPSLSLPISEPLRAQARARVSGAGTPSSAPLIAVHPWASTPEKRWPAGSFQALARALAAESAASVLVLGGPEHVDEARAFCQEVDTAINLVGSLSPVELAACLHLCALLISNDSGPVHVAAAVGTPTITLFGSPHPWQGPIRWRPWGDGHVVLHRVPIDAIRVEDVLEAARRRVPACAR